MSASRWARAAWFPGTPSAATHAHLRALHVPGHIPVGLRAHEALDAGYDEINHINQVMLNFLATPQTDTRTLERFILPADKVAALDFNAPVIKNFISRLKMKGTVIDPTLATFAFLKHKDGDLNTPFAPVAAHMPPDVARGFHVGAMKRQPGGAGAGDRQRQAPLMPACSACQNNLVHPRAARVAYNCLTNVIFRARPGGPFSPYTLRSPFLTS